MFNMSQFVPIGRGDRVRDLTVPEWRDVLALWQRKRAEYAGRMTFAAHLAQLVLATRSRRMPWARSARKSEETGDERAGTNQAVQHIQRRGTARAENTVWRRWHHGR